MLLTALLLLAAAPRPAGVEGLDKPKKVVTANLGKSELAKGDVTARCMDLGATVLVEVNDPGLIGPRAAWLERKVGDAMPPCDGDADDDVIPLEGLSGFGTVAGVRGDLVFVTSADTFGDREGLRVFHATSGEQVLDVERSTQRPASLRVDGTHVFLRLHEAIPATCDPLGERAADCWRELKAAAGVPPDVSLKAPPCDARFKAARAAPGKTLLAIPVEIDLTDPKSKRFVSGEATCDVAP
jgi:hypothetical protein